VTEITTHLICNISASYKCSIFVASVSATYCCCEKGRYSEELLFPVSLGNRVQPVRRVNILCNFNLTPQKPPPDTDLGQRHVTLRRVRHGVGKAGTDTSSLRSAIAILCQSHNCRLLPRRTESQLSPDKLLSSEMRSAVQNSTAR
jgi:hypothetical protein